MMTMRLIALVCVAAAVTMNATVDREWQVGTCTAVGSAHDVFASNGGRGEIGLGRTSVRPATPVVGTYVLETDLLRLELREIVPIGPGSLQMTVGDRVSFALQKNTAYIKDATGTEHRLRVTKQTKK